MACKDGLKEKNKPKLNLTVWKEILNKGQHSINGGLRFYHCITADDVNVQCLENKMWKDLLP